MPTIWLPLFLLWPFVILFGFAVFLVGIVVISILDTKRVRSFCRLFGGLYTMLCEFRGTKVDIEDRNARVFVQIS